MMTKGFELVCKKRTASAGLASVTLASPDYKVTIYVSEKEGEVQYPVTVYAIGKDTDVRPDVVFLTRGNVELRFPPAVPIEKVDELAKEMTRIQSVVEEVKGWIFKLEGRTEVPSPTTANYYEVDTKVLPDAVLDKEFVVRDELEKIPGIVFGGDSKVYLPEDYVQWEDEFVEWLRGQNAISQNPVAFVNTDM